MTATLILILGVMLTHWVGDFVLQTDKMARGKAKNLDALTSHVAVYYVTLVFGTGTFIWFLHGTQGDIWGLMPLWWLVNGFLHFVVDFVTSKINGRLWANDNKHNFFVAVGFDQFLHYACLFSTLSWMTGLI